MATPADSATDRLIALTDAYSAHNYEPLPVVIASGEGAWVEDVEGRRYLDFLSAYSALNFGHRHPALVEAAHRQLDRLTLTSRAVHSEPFGPFVQELAELTGLDAVLPMNTGAEAVETAIKIARKWGHEVKGIPDGDARIVVCHGNFHGRTTTIVSFSDNTTARRGFGPFTPGFVHVHYGDAEELEALLSRDPSIAGFLFEPVQGEAGVIVPPSGYLRAVRESCDRHGVLMIADEVQTGFCRTGETFACEREGVRPDVYVLGKALGGGIMPLSAAVATADVMRVITPGTHGSTFGGNPLALAVGRAVIGLVRTGEYQARSRELGAHLLERLRREAPPALVEVRGVGLWAGVEIDPSAGHAHDYCVRLLERGLIVKDTHHTTIRLAPPLCIERTDLDRAIDDLLDVLARGLDG